MNNALAAGLIWFGVAATALGAAAAGAPSVTEGKEVALSVCSYCHVVSPDQPFKPELTNPAPTFAEIANDPKTDAKSLSRFIATTHWDMVTYPMTMPNPELLDDERDHVVAYILSLRTVGPPAPRPRLSPAAHKAEAGEYLALQLCSYCHVVTDDLRYRPDEGPKAPSFADIAANAANTPKSLRHFLATTHWDVKTLPMKMPGQMLSDEQTDEVIAYLLRDRKRR